MDVLAVGPAAVDAPLLSAVAHRSGGVLMLHESAALPSERFRIEIRVFGLCSSCVHSGSGFCT